MIRNGHTARSELPLWTTSFDHARSQISPRKNFMNSRHLRWSLQQGRAVECPPRSQTSCASLDVRITSFSYVGCLQGSADLVWMQLYKRQLSWLNNSADSYQPDIDVRFDSFQDLPRRTIASLQPSFECKRVDAREKQTKK